MESATLENAAGDGEASRWDLAGFFPPGTGAADFEGVLASDLQSFSASVAGADKGCPTEIAALIDRYEDVWARCVHLSAYFTCVLARDTDDEDAMQGVGRALRYEADVSKAWAEIRSAMAALSGDDLRVLLEDPRIEAARAWLLHEREEALAGLTPDQQALAADLLIDSLHGWSGLAERIFADMTFELRRADGRIESVAFARRYDAFWGSDSDLRRSAWDGVNKAAADRAVVLAACLNGMIGSRLTLLRRRGETVQEFVARRSRMRPETINRVMDALRGARAGLLDYLADKRVLLGLERMGMQDRSAPAEDFASRPIPEDAVVGRVRQAFANAAPWLATCVDDLEARGWIDSGAEGRRRTGGFCAFLPWTGEARVFVNADGSLVGQTVVAHEIGHAYNDSCMEGLRPLLTQVPNTLAETASITAEHLFREGLLRQPGAPLSRRIEVLMADLDVAVNYVLRLGRDFEFETELYQARAEGELTVGRLCALQADAHRRWFGDSMGDDTYAWAASPLLYLGEASFLNFPYSFAFLVSSAIADRLETDPTDAVRAYQAFLRVSGRQSAEESLASTLGFDITTADFWRGALRRVDRRRAELKASVAMFRGRA